MIASRAIQTPGGNALAQADILTDFGRFLRLNTANGDAPPATIKSYWSNANQCVIWCVESGLNPALVTEDDILEYRRHLIDNFATGSVATKLAAIKRLYEAAVWRGLRPDNPAAGIRPPKDKTERAERVKYLPQMD